MNKIEILKESCSGCPMVWEVILPDGSAGYIRYRWGVISLKPITERAGLFQEPIISEQIGQDFDGFLSLEDAVAWLNQKGYDVTISPSFTN